MPVPAFTARELDIMSALWRLGPATVGEVRELLLAEGIELAYNTVLSMLRIMQDKGYVGYAAEGRAYRYHALVARDAAGRSAVRQLLNGLFDRSPEALLVHLVTDEHLDRAALKRLRALVNSELGDEPDGAA